MTRMLLTGLCCALFLSASGAAPANYAPYAPPFAAASGERRPATKIVAGKSTVTFQGSAIALRLFAGWEGTLFSPDLAHRYGGLVVESGTAAISGVRGALEGSSCGFTYPGRDGLAQRFTLLPDGRVRVELENGAGDGEVHWNLSLLGEFFGGAAIEIDGRQFRLPPYQEKAQFYNRLYDGPAKRVTFFPDVPEKTFSFEFPAGCQARLGSSGGRYGVALRLAPASKTEKFEMILEPGTVETGKIVDPQGYTLKAGAYDFWAVDRLRLPDRRGKNLLGNSSFEQGFASLWFPHGGGMFSRKLWDTKPIRVDDKDAFAGTSSLEILSDDPKAELEIGRAHV